MVECGWIIYSIGFIGVAWDQRESKLHSGSLTIQDPVTVWGNSDARRGWRGWLMENDGNISLGFWVPNPGSKSKTQRNTDEICTLASSCFWWPHLHYFLMCTSHLRSLQSDPGSSEAKKHTVRFFLHTLGQAFYPGVGLPASASSHCRIWQIWQNSNPRFECQNRFQHRWAIVRWGLLLHHLPNAWPPDSVAKTAKTDNLVCKIVRNCAVDQCMVWLDEPFPKLATRAEVQSELDLAQWKILSNQTLVGW